MEIIHNILPDLRRCHSCRHRHRYHCCYHSCRHRHRYHCCYHSCRHHHRCCRLFRNCQYHHRYYRNRHRNCQYCQCRCCQYCPELRLESLQLLHRYRRPYLRYNNSPLHRNRCCRRNADHSIQWEDWRYQNTM